MDQAIKCGVGINPGYGYVKVVLSEENRVLQTVTLPAVVRAQRQVLGALKRIQSVQVGGMAWWVGEDALLSPDASSAMTQDLSWLLVSSAVNSSCYHG